MDGQRWSIHLWRQMIVDDGQWWSSMIKNVVNNRKHGLDIVENNIQQYSTWTNN